MSLRVKTESDRMASEAGLPDTPAAIIFQSMLYSEIELPKSNRSTRQDAKERKSEKANAPIQVMPDENVSLLEFILQPQTNLESRFDIIIYV
ncbi:hypothetical protein KQX54_018562 [Cotesia glomerata]|uniref:Uncharacterized protein n=1 Tax=Cotesia glomerata TaxID=32391 RepID=A0AAV7J791_COTGL|nr:hypothetical protein KQX54_018562 [Cotesia glomerata]